MLQLPLIYINIGAASLPLALIFVKAMKIWGARPARVGVLLLAAVVMAVAAPFLEPGDNTLLLAVFIFIPAIFGLLFASLWLLAADIFENTEKREAARAFSRIGAGTLAGGMIGGLISKGLAPYLDPKWLIFLGAVVILGVVALVMHIHSRFPTNLVAKKDGEKKAGFLTPLTNKYSLTLLFISMTGALAGLLIDFQFYAAAASANMGSKGNTSFFANFYILLNFMSLLLQLFATPKIQDKVGLRGGLMVLPLALIGAAGFVTAAATALQPLRFASHGRRSALVGAPVNLGAGFHPAGLLGTLLRKARRGRHRRQDRRDSRRRRYSSLAQASRIKQRAFPCRSIRAGWFGSPWRPLRSGLSSPRSLESRLREKSEKRSHPGPRRRMRAFSRPVSMHDGVRQRGRLNRRVTQWKN